MEQLLGRQIGRYQVLEQVGRGSVATVYKGYDPEKDRHVALKVLNEKAAADLDFVQSFLRQGRAAVRLRHPALVTVFEAGSYEGRHCLVMEYLDGISLRDLIRLRGTMQADEVLAVARQVGDALDYLHGEGFVHGDVRSGNVIISPPGRVTLTELGVIRTSWEGRIAGGTVSASVAPEQVVGGELGPWADIYALGTIVYEMLSGRPPFAAESVPSLLYQVINRPPPPLGSLCPGLPRTVDQVLQKVLAKDPRMRYRSGEELATALESVLQPPIPVPLGSRPAAPSGNLVSPGVPLAAPGVAVTPQGAAPGAPAEPEVAAAPPLPEVVSVPQGAAPPRAAADEPPRGVAPAQAAVAAPPEEAMPPEVAPPAGAEPAPAEAAPEPKIRRIAPAPSPAPRLPPWEAVRPVTPVAPPAGAPPPWEAVPVQETPPRPTARPGPSPSAIGAGRLAPAARPVQGGRPGRSPAERLARARLNAAREAPKEGQRPAGGRRPALLWVLLASEVLLLLGGIALAVLLLLGIL